MLFEALTARTTSPVRRDSLLDGLEHLALSSDNSEVRESATLYLALSGTPEMPVVVQGIVPRLVHVYHARTESGVRLLIRNHLPLQTERAPAARLLRTIAAEPDTVRFRQDLIGDDRTEALARLSEMGEEGRTVLRDMHRTGEARSPQARAILEDMARRGFPVRDIRRGPR